VCGRICFEAFATLANTHNFPPDFSTPERPTHVLTLMFSHPSFFCVVVEQDGKVVGSNCWDERTTIGGVSPITIDPGAQNRIILPVVLFVIFLLLYMVFHSVVEAMVLIFPTFYAITGGLILQWVLGYNFSVAVWVGYIALFGIAVETGVVNLHESLDKRIGPGRSLTEADIHEAAIEGAVQRLRPKLMTVSAVLASLIPILWASGIGSDVMKPIVASMVGGMITSTIHVLILVPVFFVLMKERGYVAERWACSRRMQRKVNLWSIQIFRLQEATRPI
jgi:AcrB/AcrD/AcrF family